VKKLTERIYKPFGKKDFLDMLKRLNNQPAQKEYVMLGSLEFSNQMDEAVKEAVWFMKNPRLGPEQKWHHAHGFYKVLSGFGPLKAGDFILMVSYVHYRVVKIATATEKQVFYSYEENFNANMKFTPAEWKAVRPIDKWELLAIFPHLSERIKALYGNYALKQFEQ
jgi:hypothetical protein